METNGMSLGDYLLSIKEEIRREARDAAGAFFNGTMKGQDRGACGFAWVTVYPKHKGNTKEGKAERKTFEALGLEKDWTGKSYMIWSPAKFPCQNIDTHKAGARAASDVLRKYGFNAYPNSRLD